jgi:hypothetical protein
VTPTTPPSEGATFVVVPPFGVQFFYRYYDVTAAVEGAGCCYRRWLPVKRDHLTNAEFQQLAAGFRATPGLPKTGSDRGCG